MSYKLIFTEPAQKGISFLKKNRPDAIKKLRKIIPELIEHPRTGIGKPEMLMGNLKGKWSRRLNDKDRVVYEIKE